MKINKLKEIFEDESLKYALATNLAKYGRPQSKKSDKKATLTKGLEKKREKNVKDLKKSMGEQDMGSPFPIPDLDDKGYIAARKLIDQLRLTTFRKLNPDELESFRRELASAFDMTLKEAKEIELDDKEQEIVNDILFSIPEGVTATKVIDKFKDYSRKGLLTMSIILGVVQGLEAQDTVQSDIDKIQQTGIELVQQTKVTDEASENLIKKELGDQELEQIQKKAEENDYFFVAKKSKNFNFNKNRAVNQAQENSNYSGSILTKDSTTYNTDDGQELYVMFYKVSNLKIKTKIVNENKSGLDRIKFHFDKLFGPDLKFNINRDPNNPERDRIDVRGSQQDLMNFGSELGGEKMEGYEVFWTQDDDRGEIVRIVKSDSINEKKKKKDDRCTRIAKRKFDTWPSAYASGAVVRCRKGKIWKGIK